MMSSVRRPWLRLLSLGTTATLLGPGTAASYAADPATPASPLAPAAGFRFPTVPAGHTHVRALLESALRAMDPENRLVDPVSGYPVEGWNHDPKGGVFLRSFTQLTSIGQYLELMASIVAGEADTPFLSRAMAMNRLTHMVKSLRDDQQDPTLSAEGLLGNFLDLATNRRLGPLASDVDKQKFIDEFGPEKAERLWKALQEKGWIVPRKNGLEAGITREGHYGYDHFDGPLAPFNDEPTRQKILALLDQRVVMAVFGDNSNLAASVAKAIGALLTPDIKDRTDIRAVRHALEQFLDAQAPGYARLYDAKVGLFDFGWDATRHRLFGWEDPQGNWTVGHMDYFVNEFRAPLGFVVLRYALPLAAVQNLGFKIKPYSPGASAGAGRPVHVLAPWEGSAFQAMGLGVWLGELEQPSWRILLPNVVTVETDYSARHGLPGFLSESYTGRGTQYTGNVGIPEITVAPRPRITDAASLYTLGAGYMIAPEKVEAFVAANWPIISTLLTEHGPWEGYNTTEQKIIPFETTAHTLALALGILGSGNNHMTRYLESRGLLARRAELYPRSQPLDLMAERFQIAAWTDKESTHRSDRKDGTFRLDSPQLKFLGIAWISDKSTGENLSGGRLRLRYETRSGLDPVTIQLKPAAPPEQAAKWIPKEITARLTGGSHVSELEVALPAMPGLTNVKEVVLAYEPKDSTSGVDLRVVGFDVDPIEP